MYEQRVSPTYTCTTSVLLSQTKTLVNSIYLTISLSNSFVTSLNPFTHGRPCWTLFSIPCTWHNHWTWLAGILARHAILEQDEVVQLQIPVKNCWKEVRIESALVYHVTLTTHTDKMPEPKNYLVLLSFLLARVLRPRTTQLPFPCLNISLDWSEAVCIAWNPNSVGHNTYRSIQTTPTKSVNQW